MLFPMSDPTHCAPEPGGSSVARQTIFGSQEERILARLSALDPDLMAYIRDFAYDTVYERPGLDLKTKELLACVLLVSLGSPGELRTHLRGALAAGATEQEVREALLLCIPYLGFPRAVAGFDQLQGLLAARDRPRQPQESPQPEPGAQGETP
ncbi:4-carboxymuconolactone decarboxylase [Deinococcus reticulitermitis]|uniref:4-carboxymuconolactone decarboxylase n=2 Tax=Deinococcus reticulitermitis TaxID=856736 RepID=A0A1H6S101_9DEIO|nr:4-carboxymuconolactone decarboxylase [Deinococcus reticulitermitis]